MINNNIYVSASFMLDLTGSKAADIADYTVGYTLIYSIYHKYIKHHYKYKSIRGY